tara:strand:- start:1011 stop:1424 length:414 start_codon:yes stop_codon:yes gene_type:complete
LRDEAREKKRDEARGEERATVRVVHRVARNRAQLLERERMRRDFFLDFTSSRSKNSKTNIYNEKTNASSFLRRKSVYEKTWRMYSLQNSGANESCRHVRVVKDDSMVVPVFSCLLPSRRALDVFVVVLFIAGTFVQN